MNQAADVMTENLAEYLVFHRDICLAANMIPKLPVDYRECRFNVGSFVVGKK